MMSDNVEFEGKDLEEALEEAAGELGLPEEDLHYEIVEQGRRGVMGLGAKNVRIRVTDQMGAEDKDGAPAARPSRPRQTKEQAQPPVSEVPAAVATDIAATTQQILDLAGLELSAELVPTDGGVGIEIAGADRKRLVSRKAELLGAIQFLLNRMARRKWPDAQRIHVSSDGKTTGLGRDDELVELTREVAQKVSHTGRTQKLPPMNSYERRLVHLTVREFGGLTSSSDGQGARKRVRISKVRNTVA